MEYMRKLWWVVRGVLVLLNNLYCIPAYVVWMAVLSPLLLFDPQLYWWIEGIFFQWLLLMVGFWSHSAQYTIVETGDQVESLIGQETLLLINHQSTSDVPMLMYGFAAKQKILPSLNWIMDAVFKYTNFGAVSALHGDFFIYAGRDKRDASIKDLVEYLRHVWVPRKRKWLVLFPEGGFLRKRKEPSNRYCRKIGMAELTNVTLPRMGAIQAIMDVIGPGIKPEAKPEASPIGPHGDSGIEPASPSVPVCRNGRLIWTSNPNFQPSQNHVVQHNGNNNEVSDNKPLGLLQWVVDMTIAYPKGKPLDLFAIVTGCAAPYKINFHYKIYPIHQVPTESKEFTKWVYDLYVEKDKTLGEFYETGRWPEHRREAKSDDEESGITQLCPEEEGRVVQLDVARVLLVHLFFLFSTLTHLVIFGKLLNYL